MARNRYDLDFIDRATKALVGRESFDFANDRQAIVQAELLSVGPAMVLRCGARSVRRFPAVPA